MNTSSIWRGRRRTGREREGGEAWGGEGGHTWAEFIRDWWGELSPHPMNYSLSEKNCQNRSDNLAAFCAQQATTLKLVRQNYLSPFSQWSGVRMFQTDKQTDGIGDYMV